MGFSRSIGSYDLFLLYTDGMIEARNPSGEEFGSQRLIATLQQYVGSPVVRLTEAMIETLNRFSAGVPWTDDICLVAVEIAPTGKGSTTT